jgi:curved DNA-binding protein
VPLTITEATLGHKVEVPTIDDTRLTVTIPPGTPSGARLRLRGKGIKGGNQYIQIKIVPPREIDARGRELLEEFSRLYAQDPRKGTGWS